MLNPLPTGFFMETNDGNDLWIQFKLERLLDFCYTCGMLDNVTGRCNSREPMIATTLNGLSAKLLGSWMRAENNDTILFINTLMRVERRLLEEEEEELEPRRLTLLLQDSKHDNIGQIDGNDVR